MPPPVACIRSFLGNRTKPNILFCFVLFGPKWPASNGENGHLGDLNTQSCDEQRSIQDVRKRGARTARLPGGTLRPTDTHTLSGCGVNGKRGFPRGLCPVVVVVPPPFLRDWWRGSGRGPQARQVYEVLCTTAPLPPAASPQREEARGRTSSQRGGKGSALESHLPPSRAFPMCDTPGFPPEGRALEFARRGLQEFRLEAMVCVPKSDMV